MTTDTKLAYADWLGELKAAFIKYGAMTADEAHNYVFDNSADWRESYDDGFSADDAANEDMMCWDE